MNAKSCAASVATLLALAHPRAGLAEEWVVSVDPQASTIQFTLGATLHTVHGSLKFEECEVRFDSGTGQLLGQLVVDARSADTQNERRDRDMHEKVLESDRFPTITLTPERLEGEIDPGGTSSAVIHGVLAVHGDTHPVAVPIEVRIERGELSASAHLTVPYVEWGLKDPSKLVLRVKKVVEVEITLAGSFRAAEP